MNAIVTCIYNGLFDTKFGGRHHRVSRYQDGLLTLSKTHEMIFCFTSKNDYNVLEKYLDDHKITNVNLLILSLDYMFFHTKIQDIKLNFPEKFEDLFWQHRCVELMWGKFIMIKQIIDLNFDIENIFWMDAGLAHHDVISQKYEYVGRLYNRNFSNPKNLFNNDLLNKLIKFIDGKILLIETRFPHNMPIPAKYNAINYTNNHGVIGGLFGGNIKYLQILIGEFFKKVTKILNDNELYGEENILFAILTDMPELFKTFLFDSWYHEGWGELFDPNKINFSNFFDVLMDDYNG